MNPTPWQVLRTVILATTLAGCSLVLDLDGAQCSTTADCVAKGPAFRNTVCSRGSCEQTTANDLSTNELDASAGDDASNGNEAAPSNVADLPGSSGCVSTSRCVSDNLDEPYVCKKAGDPCVPLKTEECPLVFGDFRSDNAVYLGAFLNVPAGAPLSQMSTLNVQLALNEFNGSVGGLPGGPLGKLRPLVAVVCRNEPDLIETAGRHLIEEVGIPAVLAHLASADLKTFFADQALPAKVFVINPGFADNSLTALSSEGLFWHVIGDIRDVGPAYAPLMSRVEQFINPPPADGSPTPAIRVAMLVGKRYAEQSIADTITPVLRFNGKSVTDNGSNFYPLAVPVLADEPNADYSSVTEALIGFRPHVVISITREEFVYKILPTLEGGWGVAPKGQKRPFYILPTALSGNLDLLKYLGQDSPGVTAENKRQRTVGVAPASAADMTLYNQFMLRFRTAYPYFQNPGGFENFYDAVYLLANAMFAAGSVPALTGPDVARGMLKVVTGSTEVEVGPTHIADGFAALAVGGAIRLEGTMGPADFDPTLGARRGSGSVYCFQTDGSSTSFAYDVLRYQASDSSLTGEFPCFSGF